MRPNGQSVRRVGGFGANVPYWFLGCQMSTYPTG
jgi:hypothetical protein